MWTGVNCSALRGAAESRSQAGVTINIGTDSSAGEAFTRPVFKPRLRDAKVGSDGEVQIHQHLDKTRLEPCSVLMS